MPPNVLVATFKILDKSAVGAVLAVVASFLVKFMLVSIVTYINKGEEILHPFANMLFLLFQRPLFVLFGGFAAMPFILSNNTLYPMKMFLGNNIFFALSRLTYGAYLCGGVFMLFTI